MMDTYDLNNLDIEKLMADTVAYNDFVYTPFHKAIAEIKLRRKDKELKKTVDEFLDGDIPKPLQKTFKAVLYRQLTTPNYEFRRFLEVIKGADVLPMLLEYSEDKFTSLNSLKRSLGKMKFQIFDDNEHKKSRVDSKNVIDFNVCDGKRFKDIQTNYGDSLIDFHHGLLRKIYPEYKKHLYDASKWFHRRGKNAKSYYEIYLALFIRNGILFENFLPEGNEFKFVKEIFLPSFIDIWKRIGSKPLIVNLLPFDSQKDDFWFSHPLETLISIQASKENAKMV